MEEATERKYIALFIIVFTKKNKHLMKEKTIESLQLAQFSQKI